MHIKPESISSLKVGGLLSGIACIYILGHVWDVYEGRGHVVRNGAAAEEVRGPPPKLRVFFLNANRKF